MFNVYVHLDVHELPADIVDQDEFLDELGRELPDAALGGRDGLLTITLSQFGLSCDRVAARQLERTRRAFATLGCPDIRARVDETVREGWRDDVSVLVGIVRSQVCRRLAPRM